MKIGNVLSLFDGMSGGQQALHRAGISFDKYYASEIDKYAIQVTQKNYPDTIQLGDVRNIDIDALPSIDLLFAGSPCQSFSFAGKRNGMSTKCSIEITTLEQYLELRAEEFEFEGQSYLFWEFMRILKAVKPKYFLLENVMMGDKWEKILSRAVGYNPLVINSALVSGQNRIRNYWTNIGIVADGFFGYPKSIIQQPKDQGILLKDVLEKDVDDKYYMSEKMIAGFEKHAERHKEKGTGFFWKPNYGEGKGNCLRTNGALSATDNIIKVDKNGQPKKNQEKASCFTAGGNSGGNHSDMDLIVCHNTMPRSSKTGKGGTGPLSRTDGKTYCLDTGRTNAIEILGGDFRYDEGFRIREGGKTPTLCTKGEVFVFRGETVYRRLTPIECERLQTVADNYTEGVSDSQRYKMIGNGWNIETIAHILRYIGK